MEDLYVKPNYRKHGVGRMLIQEVARFASEQGCCRIDFQSLKWNPAIQFYEKLGAVNLTESNGWLYYVYRKDDLHKLCNN